MPRSKRGKKKLEYSYEVIEALFVYLDENSSDELRSLAKILNDLYLATGCNDFHEEMINLCNRHDLCTHCLEGNVKDVCIGGISVEYFGKPAELPEYKRVCDNCGVEQL